MRRSDQATNNSAAATASSIQQEQQPQAASNSIISGVNSPAHIPHQQSVSFLAPSEGARTYAILAISPSAPCWKSGDGSCHQKKRTFASSLLSLARAIGSCRSKSRRNKFKNAYKNTVSLASAVHLDLVKQWFCRNFSTNGHKNGPRRTRLRL